MYISYSKVLAKFGGGRLGFGIRVTKKNALWMSLVYLFVLCFQLVWYLMLLVCWAYYMIFRWIYLGIKKLVGMIKEHIAAKKNITQ